MAGNTGQQAMDRRFKEPVEQYVNTQSPADVITEYLQENEALKQRVALQEETLAKYAKALDNQNARLEKFKELGLEKIVDDPVEKLTVDLEDTYVIAQIRKTMVQIWGAGASLDGEGRWLQTALNRKFRILMNEIIKYGVMHRHRVIAIVKNLERIDENATQQGPEART